MTLFRPYHGLLQHTQPLHGLHCKQVHVVHDHSWPIFAMQRVGRVTAQTLQCSAQMQEAPILLHLPTGCHAMAASTHQKTKPSRHACSQVSTDD